MNAKTDKKTKLIGVLPRLTSTWGLFWQQRVKLMALAAIVVVPSSFLRSYQALTVDFSLILFMAGIYAVLALIYYCHHMADAQNLSAPRVYTLASGRFLQILGVSLIQSLVLVPVIFSAALLLFVGSFSLPVWLYLPGGVFLVLSLVVATGLSQVQFIAASEDLSVVGALRASWKRTKGNKLRVLLHLLAFFLLAGLVSAAIFFVVNMSSFLATSWFVQGLVSSLLVVVALPWLIVYGYSIYDELS